MSNRKYFKINIDGSQLQGTDTVNFYDYGFIDSKRPWEYADFKADGSLGTKADFIWRCRGYNRWLLLTTNIASGSLNKIENIVETGASSIVAPTEIEFDVSFDQWSAMSDYNLTGNLITGVDALKYRIAKALVYDFNQFVYYFDPTRINVHGGTNNSNAVGYNYILTDINSPSAGATLALKFTDVESKITVTEIDI